MSPYGLIDLSQFYAMDNSKVLGDNDGSNSFAFRGKSPLEKSQKLCFMKKPSDPNSGSSGNKNMDNSPSSGLKVLGKFSKATLADHCVKQIDLQKTEAVFDGNFKVKNTKSKTDLVRGDIIDRSQSP